MEQLTALYRHNGDTSTEKKELCDFAQNPSVMADLSEAQTNQVFPIYLTAAAYRCNHFYLFCMDTNQSDVYLKQRDPCCDVKHKTSSVAKTRGKFGQGILIYGFYPADFNIPMDALHTTILSK